MAGNLIALDIGQYQAKLVWYTGKSVKKAVAAPLPDGLVENCGVYAPVRAADDDRRAACLQISV